MILKVCAPNSKMGYRFTRPPFDVFDICKRKRECTNEKNVCTNDPESLGSAFKKGGFIVHQPHTFDAFDILYKHKRECTNEKNVCTDAPTILRAWAQTSKMGVLVKFISLIFRNGREGLDLWYVYWDSTRQFLWILWGCYYFCSKWTPALKFLH